MLPGPPCPLLCCRTAGGVALCDRAVCHSLDSLPEVERLRCASAVSDHSAPAAGVIHLLLGAAWPTTAPCCNGHTVLLGEVGGVDGSGFLRRGAAPAYYAEDFVSVSSGTQHISGALAVDGVMHQA